MNKNMKLKLEEYQEYFEHDDIKALLAVIADSLNEISLNTENIANKMWE